MVDKLNLTVIGMWKSVLLYILRKRVNGCLRLRDGQRYIETYISKMR